VTGGERPGGKPAVLCVTVSYNSARDLPDHLTSVLSQSPPPARVVVVDNASADSSVTLVQSAFPQVEVIANPRNTGYGAAVNQGLALALEAGIPYLLALNPDVVLAPGSISALLAAMEEHPAAAAANPEIGDRPRAGPAPAATRIVEWLSGMSGCAMLLRVEALRRVGGFWPDFFLYGEDTDLLCRLRRTGWSFAKVPAAHAHHLGQRSSKRLLGGARVYYYLVRNHFLWVKRNRWHEGLGPCLRTIAWAVRAQTTWRRLLHPTRLAALALGLTVGACRFVRTPAWEPPPGAGPGEDGERGA
jgi:GT2 family glycosyltransferase